MEEVKKSNAIVTIIKSFLYLGAYLVIQCFISFFYVIVIGVKYFEINGVENIEGFREFVIENLNTNVILGISIFITFGILLIIMTAKKKSFKEYFSIHKINKKVIPLLILLGISINLIMAGSLNLLSGVPQLDDTMNEYAEQSSQLVEDNIVFNILILAIIVPILEEFIYRVLPLNTMIPRISPVIAVILTAIAFGISHGQIIWTIYTSLFGILLAVIFLKYKSSIANILVHCAFNITSLILVNLPIEVQDNFKASIIVTVIGIIAAIIIGILFKTLNIKNNELVENYEEKDT